MFRIFVLKDDDQFHLIRCNINLDLNNFHTFFVKLYQLNPSAIKIFLVIISQLIFQMHRTNKSFQNYQKLQCLFLQNFPFRVLF
jgi:hypothetical protein